MGNDIDQPESSDCATKTFVFVSLSQSKERRQNDCLKVATSYITMTTPPPPRLSRLPKRSISVGGQVQVSTGAGTTISTPVMAMPSPSPLPLSVAHPMQLTRSASIGRPVTIIRCPFFLLLLYWLTSTSTCDIWFMV
jgi:hypothetical protein